MHVLDRLRNDTEVGLMHLAKEQIGIWPFFQSVGSSIGPEVVMDGSPRVMFGSSNFLGLAQDPRLARAARDAIDRYGTATNGSPILNGTLDLHRELEAELAEWLSAEAAIVFPSGYSTNLGVIATVLTDADVAISDTGAHASILDGITQSGARLRPFRHNRLDRMEAALRSARAEGRDDAGILVTVDSVYSMIGDVADLPRTVELCREYDACLLADEAHAFGVMGPSGGGLAVEQGVAEGVDLRVGTLSKALAASGGFVIGDEDVIDAIRIKARSSLFTASLSPPLAGAALASVRIARTPERDERAEALMANVRRLRSGLAELGYEVPATSLAPDGSEVLTPIIPVIGGGEPETFCLWRALFDAGVYTHVAMYPSVPRGRAIVRLFVTAVHTEEHVDRALAAFDVARTQRERIYRERVAAHVDAIAA